MTDELGAPAEIIDLSNGLILELYDASRKLTGDRWTVVLIARIDVPTGEHEKELGGPAVTYEQRREWVFVPREETAAAFRELRESFLAAQKVYLSRGDFAARFLAKKRHEAASRPR